MEREQTGFEGYVRVCCVRDDKVYKATSNDPLAQICNECKADALMKECIAAMRTLDTERILQIITAFIKRE